MMGLIAPSFQVATQADMSLAGNRDSPENAFEDVAETQGAIDARLLYLDTVTVRSVSKQTSMLDINDSFDHPVICHGDDYLLPMPSHPLRL